MTGTGKEYKTLPPGKTPIERDGHGLFKAALEDTQDGESLAHEKERDTQLAERET
jgi:hypothetical protein